MNSVVSGYMLKKENTKIILDYIGRLLLGHYGDKQLFVDEWLAEKQR